MSPCGVTNQSPNIVDDLASSGGYSRQAHVTDDQLAFEAWWEKASAQYQQETQRKQSPLSSRDAKPKALPGTSLLRRKLRTPFQRKPSEVKKQPKSPVAAVKTAGDAFPTDLALAEEELVLQAFSVQEPIKRTAQYQHIAQQQQVALASIVRQQQEAWEIFAAKKNGTEKNDLKQRASSRGGTSEEQHQLLLQTLTTRFSDSERRARLELFLRQQQEELEAIAQGLSPLPQQQRRETSVLSKLDLFLSIAKHLPTESRRERLASYLRLQQQGMTRLERGEELSPRPMVEEKGTADQENTNNSGLSESLDLIFEFAEHVPKLERLLEFLQSQRDEFVGLEQGIESPRPPSTETPIGIPTEISVPTTAPYDERSLARIRERNPALRGGRKVTPTVVTPPLSVAEVPRPPPYAPSRDDHSMDCQFRTRMFL